MRTPLMLGFATLALTVTGCFSLPDAPALPGRISTDGSGLATGSLRVSEVEQSGSMGQVRNFLGGGDELSASYSESSSYVRIDSLGRNWWVMSGLNISGDLAGPAFAPGTHRVYTNGVASDGSSLSLTACSGPSMGNYTFDAPADEVAIDVADAGRGARFLMFRATHRDGTVSQGQFVYEVAPDGV